jgi:hypothetical protein
VDQANTVSVGAVIRLSVLANSVAGEQAPNLPVAVYRPDGSPPGCTHGRGVSIEKHHDVNHGTSDGLPCAALNAHECVLVEDAR